MPEILRKESAIDKLSPETKSVISRKINEIVKMQDTADQLDEKIKAEKAFVLNLMRGNGILEYTTDEKGFAVFVSKNSRKIINTENLIKLLSKDDRLSIFNKADIKEIDKLDAKYDGKLQEFITTDTIDEIRVRQKK